MSINSSKKSYGLFDDEEDFETVPFSSLEKNQRNVTKEREFYYLYTPYIAILVNIIIFLFFGSLFVPFDEDGAGYNLIIIIYIIIWCILAITYRFMHVIHSTARSRGYFSFYDTGHTLTQVPFLIWSAGMAFIGLLFVFVPAGTTLWGLYPSSFLQIFVGLQTIVITLITIWYCVVACAHNRNKALPDANDYLQSYEGNKSLGEKQAEMIQYLEEKQEILGKEIVSLHSQLEAQQTHEKNSAHNDMIHEMKKKDSEILTLESLCKSLRAQIESLEQQRLDNIEDKYAENTRELKNVKEKLSDTLQDNHKLKLMYEVEKDALADAQEEIELLKQTLINHGIPVEEKTIYDD